MLVRRSTAFAAAVSVNILLQIPSSHAAGDLSRQTPIELTVELGRPGGQHGCAEQVDV